MGVVVLVPAYQAALELAQCLASLEATLPSGVPVLVADDASPDAAVGEVIEAARARGRLTMRHVRRQKNLGFVGNVNLGFAETAPDDVILLNSDTQALPGWFEAICRCATSDPRIGTITPWSNNAEICSLPRFCEAAPMPTPEEGARVAAVLEALPAAEYPELPTGVGFCMFVRRAMLQAIGDFDQATFGRGYGEENDLCRRAAGHGWRNVLCPQAYVAHAGGASFGPEGHHPGGENLARLVARYPHYNALVADFILRDPLASLRGRIVEALAKATRDATPFSVTQTELFPPR